MVRVVTMFAVALIAGLLASPALGWAQSALPRFEAVEEGAPFPVEVSGPRYQRGFLVVAQSNHPDDEVELRLPVVIVRAQTPVPGLAPVVFLPGGPGEGGLSAAQFPGAYPWSAERDFVIFGRRGTRYAVPSMQCEAIGPALVSRKPGAQSRLEQAIADCKSALEAQGLRRDAYNTAASASDLEALRTALGYEQWSFLGLSYGTRLALTYAREYPEHVQSMVLDSPLPHGVHFDDAYPAHLEAALRRVAQMCAESFDCNTVYPDLEERFFAAIEAAPRQCGEGRVCQREIVNSVPLASTFDLERAPRLMDEAPRLEAGHDRAAYASDFDWGVRLSVWCSEALPYAQRRNGPLPDSFAGLDSATFTPETCALWEVSVRPEAEIEPTVSSAPTLILAGELDALTPPRWGYEAAQILSQSRVISIPYGFHTETTNWDGDGCAMSLAARFFSSPEAMLSETTVPSCIVRRGPPDFRLE